MTFTVVLPHQHCTLPAFYWKGNVLADGVCNYKDDPKQFQSTSGNGLAKTNQEQGHGSVDMHAIPDLCQ